ncbi:uncharacterized protein LOC124268339 [Haliotis rubra]|uniref:uncharacterized protein LOC124268339 n=1 Tax=Haliotis rubra TaxID=36100 RepID=UPI001EE56902|nr:uncharacterized protein LOC124268339 [Haliotis rubra]
MIPRSLSHISNTRCREKRIHKKVKKKTRKRKKKRACRQTEHEIPTDLAQDHLVPASHCTEDDIPQATDTTGVMSPQTRLNKLAELCETIYQENMAGVSHREDGCDSRINASVVENLSDNTVQSVQSNTDRMYPSSSQQTSPVTATSSGNAVNLNMSSLGPVYELGPPQTICLIIPDDGVSSTGVQVTDSVVTLDNNAETVPNLDRDGHATSSHSDTLQQHNVTSETVTAPGALECFFESQNSSGQLTCVIALMKETLRTEVERESKESDSLLTSGSVCSQTLPVRCIGESASNDKPPVPQTAVSLVAQVSRLWAGDFRRAQQLILRSHFAGQDIQNDTPLLEVLSAVIVGAFEAKLDCLAFLETLKIYPHHLQTAWSEQKTIAVDPAASYRIGTYTVSGSDILRLEGTSWLDDSVVHAYLSLVQKQHTDARSQAVWIMECFQYKLWEKHNYSQWLHEQTEFKKYDLLLMPICVNSHWLLLAANVRDRTVCVINSRPSKDLETEVSQHWMKYMECRSRVMEEELRSWSLVQCPVFPQTDGSSCGVFVLMAAEALAARVSPCLMRNCHVAAYRQYVKQRLMSAVVLAVDEQAETVMSMEFAQEEIQVTDVSGSESTPDVSNSNLTPGVSGSELTPDVSGCRPTPMDCEMNETENVNVSAKTLLSKEESTGSSMAEIDHVHSDATSLGHVETTRDRNYSVRSSIPYECNGSQTNEEDMKIEVAKDSVQDHSGQMESGSCVNTLDHVSTRSQCEALFESQKPNFSALMLLCLEKGKLMTSNPDDAAEECPLQGHMRWSCQLTRIDEMSKDQFRQCLHGLTGSLLTSQDTVVQFRYKDTQFHVEAIIKAAAVEYICELDPLFIYRHVKVLWASLKNDPGFTIYLDKSRQKDLALHFATEIEKHNFAFTLTHQACGKHTFASTLVRSIGMGTSVHRNVRELFKTCDKTHGGTFLNWICFGRNAELYKVLSSYMTEEERKECVIPCCVSGNSEILHLLLEDMELDVILSLSPGLQVVYGIDICKGQTECLQTHHLPHYISASYYGHADIVQLLLQYGCDVNAQLEPQLVRQDTSLPDQHQLLNKDGNTPVHLACQEGRIDVVDILLKRNADLTILNFDNCSPLHVWACKNGHIDTVKLLIEKGADVSAADGHGNTPLSWVCVTGHIDIVKLLIEKGADVSTARGYRYTPLSWACKNGHIDIVKLLIEKGADVSAADGNGDTPLSWACENGHIDIVKLLIEKGADVSTARGYRDTPLSWACENGHIDIVKLLIEKGADVSTARGYRDTPLSWACKNGRIDIVKLLIEKGADVSAARGYGYTPLSWACENGHIDIVKLLIEKGADVSAAGVYGYTPLSWACENGHIDIVKLLIEKGADVSAADGYRYTPLSWACKNGHIDIVKLLIEKGADVSAADGNRYTPLSWACGNCHIDIVKLLIEKGADVSASDGDGYTPLSLTCENGHIDTVKLLIEKGADVSAADGGGDTPLSCACKNVHIDIVKLLIEKEADVSAADGDGYTPLSWACKNGHIDTFKLLIEKGADVSAADCNGDTPLSWACKNGHIDTVKLLIEKGADVSAADGHGNTPLSWVCVTGHIDIVKLLIEKGADVSAAAGVTPLSWACENGHIDTVKLLIEKGADVSAADCDGDTPLSWACKNGHIDTVKLLIEKGADVSAADGHGNTPLSWVCVTGHIDIVKLLIEKGADVSAANGHGNTPLSCACKNGHIDIVKLLIEKGADVSAADGHGNTPLSWACKNGHIDTVKLLIEKGTDVSAAAGDTPLSWACKNGHIDIVKLLIEKGVDVSALGYNMNISAGWFTKGEREVVSLLLKEVLPKHVTSLSDYCHRSLIDWVFSSESQDIVKHVCDRSDQKSFPGRLCQSSLEKAVVKGDAYGVWLITEYATPVFSNDLLLSLMSAAIEKRHIAVFQMLHCIPHVHDSSDTLVQKACHYGLVEVCNVLLRCGSNHSGVCFTKHSK